MMDIKLMKYSNIILNNKISSTIIIIKMDHIEKSEYKNSNNFIILFI